MRNKGCSEVDFNGNLKRASASTCGIVIVNPNYSAALHRDVSVEVSSGYF